MDEERLKKPSHGLFWIGARLKELRKPKKNLARAIGLAEPRISEIISGDRKIKVNELAALSRFLEMPVTEILQRLSGDGGFGSDPVPLAASTAAKRDAELSRRVYTATRDVLELFVRHNLQNLSPEEVESYAKVIARCISEPALQYPNRNDATCENMAAYIHDHRELVEPSE